MKKLTVAESRNAIALVGSSRISLAALIVGETFGFELQADPKIANKLDNNNIGQVIANIKGDKTRGEMSIYRVGGMLVIADSGKITHREPYGITHSKHGDADNNRQTRDLGITTFGQYAKRADIADNLDITKLKFKVVGKVAVVNRFSSEPSDEKRKLLYRNECYSDFDSFNETVGNLDMNIDADREAFTSARNSLHSSNLKEGVEADPSNLVLAPVVEIK